MTTHARGLLLTVWLLLEVVVAVALPDSLGGPWGPWLNGALVVPLGFIFWRWPPSMGRGRTEVSYGVDRGEAERLGVEGVPMAATVHVAGQWHQGLLTLGDQHMRLWSSTGGAGWAASRSGLAVGPARPTWWREEWHLQRGGMVVVPLLQPEPGVLCVFPAAAGEVKRWVAEGSPRGSSGRPSGGAGLAWCHRCEARIDAAAERCPLCGALQGSRRRGVAPGPG